MSAIAVEGVAKTYRSAFGRERVEALRGVTLSVEPGEIFGLLGPNGAGKTTLLKVLLSVVTPTAGTARLFGRSVRDAEARARIGFLPENHRFPDFLTGRQLLDLYGRISGVPDERRRARIGALAERVRMTDWLDTRVRKYSKGMMQRIGLAQALLNDPDLVFLDEPTDGVDPVGRREIRDLLVWMRGEGKTVFLNSHLLSEVEQVCTRVAILDKGRLVREGSVAELTAAERAYELLATPIPPEALPDEDGVVVPLSAAADGLHRYRLRLEGRPALNAYLDRLRAAGVEVEALHAQRQTLEDYFIDVVQDRGAASSPHQEVAA